MALNIASNENAERIAAALETIAQHQMEPEGEFDPSVAQRLVRHGLGAASYPIGTGIVLDHETYGEHKFYVIGQDHDTDARGLLEHSMTLQMDDQIADGTPFDAPEALIYAVQAISAGSTFHFAAPLLNEVPEGNYEFTVGTEVPAGGQIMLVKNGTNWNMKSYSDATSTTVIETIVCTSGTGGTDLGSIEDATNPLMHAGIKAAEIAGGTELVINHGSCTQHGYNRWSQSAIRQWLNSGAESNSWWAPQNVFDRPPSYANRPGYLAGFDAGLLNVLGSITHSTALNNVTDGGTSETVTDKVFLLSRAEMGLGVERAGQNDGTVYEFWDGAAATDRIKLRGSSAANWWLRTPDSGIANGVHRVNTDGALGYFIANNTVGVAPACVIM